MREDTGRGVIARLGPIAALLLFGGFGVAAAQEVRGLSRWSLGVGLVHHVQSDELASPLRYSGWGPGVRLAYGRERPDARGSLLLDYVAPTLTSHVTRQGEPSEATHRLTLGASYLRRAMTTGGERFSVFAGPGLAVDGLYRSHQYRAVGNEAYFDGIATLQAAGGWEYQVTPGLRMVHRLAVPVIGVLWRTPYTGLKYVPEARLGLLTSMLGIEHEFRVERALSPSLDLVATHHLSAFRHDDPWRLATFTNRLRVGVDVRRRHEARAGTGFRGSS